MVFWTWTIKNVSHLTWANTNWSLSKSAAAVRVLALYLDTNWLLMAGRNLCLFCYKDNCHNIWENTQVIQWNDSKLQKKSNSNFHLYSLPRGLTLPDTSCPREVWNCTFTFQQSTVHLHASNVYPIRDTRVSYDSSKLSWKNITNSVATILKVKTSMRGWRAGDRIYLDGLHYCTADASSLFKCNSRIPLWPPGKGRSASQSGAPLPQTWHLIWQPSHCTVCD